MKNQAKAEKEVKLLKLNYDRDRSYLNEHDADVAARSIEFYDQQLELGTFSPEYKSKWYRGPWMETSMRYQHNSVRGFCTEMSSVILINLANKDGGLYAKFDDRKTKQREVDGTDIMLCNSNWPYDVPAQVKTITVNNNKTTFTAYKRFFDPKYKIDRLILTDPENMFLIHVDYVSFERYFKRISKGSSEVEINIAHMYDRYHTPVNYCWTIDYDKL
jgi:hypothetical protein